MSGKQKGLEDADTKNPRLDEKKAEEGGIESARAKGTVKTGETLNTDKERSPEK